MTKPKRPNSRRNLDIVINRLYICTGQEPICVGRLIVAVTVGQMLPNGVAEGGDVLKIRLGKNVMCFSRDFDVARASSLEEYVSCLEDPLIDGWSGFTRIIVSKEPASPRGVPTAYIMHPFNIKPVYNGKSWMALPLEVGHNKIGDVEDPDTVFPPEVAATLKELGLSEPAPVPRVRFEHQIAQRLHAFSGVGNECAHDLIGPQIAITGGSLDYLEVRKIYVRFFEYRQEQGWPPTLTEEEGWESPYGTQVQGLGVLPSANGAVDWANSLVAKIEASAQPPIVFDTQCLSLDRTQLPGEAIERVVAPSRTWESFCRKLVPRYDLASYV